MTIIYLFGAAVMIGFLMGLVYERTRLRAAHEQRQRQAREALEYLQSTYGARVVRHSRGDFEGGRGPHDIGVETPAAWTDKKEEPDDETS